LTGSRPSAPADSLVHSPLSQRGIPLLLALLALLDLRVELQLLAEHFTLTALWFALANHPLAVAVLVLTPSLFRRYR
jgi:hypothetical protein